MMHENDARSALSFQKRCFQQKLKWCKLALSYQKDVFNKNSNGANWHRANDFVFNWNSPFPQQIPLSSCSSQLRSTIDQYEWVHWCWLNEMINETFLSNIYKNMLTFSPVRWTELESLSSTPDISLRSHLNANKGFLIKVLLALEN